MVTMPAPSHCTARMVQLLMPSPLTATTQQPHWLVAQPTCVPVRARFSRRNWTSRVRGSTLPVAFLPFTVMVTLGISILPLGPRRSRLLLVQVSRAARTRSTSAGEEIKHHRHQHRKNRDPQHRRQPAAGTRYCCGQCCGHGPVSYTHLTLPTIYSV